MSQLLDKETLKKMIRENVKTLYRKTLEAASAEEVYRPLCLLFATLSPTNG